MNTTYSTILKPYEKAGFQYTNRYKRYGMADAVIITDKCVKDIKDINAESAVIIDVCDFSFLSSIKRLSNICIVFTKKLRKPIDINTLYSGNMRTLILRDSFKNISKVDINKMPQLARLGIRLAAIDLTCKNINLLSLELDDIGDVFDFKFINNFPALKSLMVENGKILTFDKINCANLLENLIVKKANITSCDGLDKLIKLKNLSICGIFGSDIITKLSNLKNLEHLELDCFTEIDNVDFVKDLPNLKTIILGCMIHCGDLSPLKNLRHAKLKVNCPHYNLQDGDLPKDNSIYLKSIGDMED